LPESFYFYIVIKWYLDDFSLSRNFVLSLPKPERQRSQNKTKNGRYKPKTNQNSSHKLKEKEKRCVSSCRKTPFSEENNENGSRRAVVVATIATALDPFGHLVQVGGVDVAIALEEDGFVRVDIGAEVGVVGQHVAVARRVALLLVLLGAVVGVHHDVQLVAGGLDDGRRADFRGHGAVPPVEAAVDARVQVREHVLSVGDGRFRHCSADLWAGEEERLESDEICRPDHGLDVEDGPAVGCHSDELWLRVSAVVWPRSPPVSFYMTVGGADEGGETYLYFVGDLVEVSITPT